MSDNPITPISVAETAEQQAEVKKENLAVKDLVAVDECLSELTGGPADETISSRAARAALQGKLWGKALSGFLNLFQKDHGAKAIAGDVERAESVIVIEDKSGAINAVATAAPVESVTEIHVTPKPQPTSGDSSHA